MQPVLQAIYDRRSRREFTDQIIDVEVLNEIIKAGIWAPSGLNNQPWRFVVITDPAVIKELSTTTHYTHIVEGAPALIAVYLDTQTMYDEVKDHQAVGACIQNMLLAIEDLGLGGVWLGQILKNKNDVSDILGVGDDYDLMAVLALGHPAKTDQQSNRKNLEDFILKYI
ncbi:MAG: nitroreductase [Desulfobulbaceae bacterium]|jgi:nitroreductase|nr:nitroreductase [Desulfobulbaceae bacterium]